MCKWGTETGVMVKIPADLSHTGEALWCVKGIDACLAPIVMALQDAGIDMRASCCGHGRGVGSIELADGRMIYIAATGANHGDRLDLIRRIDALQASRNRVHWITIAPLLVQDVAAYLRQQTVAEAQSAPSVVAEDLPGKSGVSDV